MFSVLPLFLFLYLDVHDMYLIVAILIVSMFILYIWSSLLMCLVWANKLYFYRQPHVHMSNLIKLRPLN